MNKLEQLQQYLLQQGILQEDKVKEEIAKMAKILPDSIAADKGLETEIDRAFEQMLIMTNQQSAGATQQPAPTRTQAAPTTSMPTSTATAAEIATVQQRLMENQDETNSIRTGSEIVKYLLNRPNPADQIPAGTVGVIDKKSWEDSIASKFVAKGDRPAIWKLVPDQMDPETQAMIKSESNYRALEAAMQSGTPVEVHVGAWVTRPTGYVARIATAAGAEQQEKVFTRQEMFDFLLWKAGGYLGQPKSDTQENASVKLKISKVRENSKDPGSRKIDKTVMVDNNRKNFAEVPGHCESIREVDANNKTLQNLKSALSFRVEDLSTTKADGTHPIKTVRVTVKATIPELAMKPGFKEKFYVPKKDATRPPQTPEELATMASLIAKSRIDAVKSNPNLAFTLGKDPEYKAEIEAIRATVGNAPAGVGI